MGERYAKAVGDLIHSLNDPDHRDESAQILRKLIDKIVLTPVKSSEDQSALAVDLFGDLAGILQISERHNGKIELKPRESLARRELSELEQVEKLLEGCVTEKNCGFQVPYGTVVAGVGFEPTTFRL